MMHLLCLTLRFQLSSGKTILSVVFRVNLESAMRTPKTQSIFHLRTRRNAYYRDTRQPTEPEKTFLCMDLSRWTQTKNQCHRYTCPLPADKDSSPYLSVLFLEYNSATQPSLLTIPL